MTLPTGRVRTASITNLGCKVNQSEMEAAARLLRAAGVALVDDGALADLVLVNTCTVTSTADHKSRQAVRRARRANPAVELVVTGCSVQVDREAFAEADPRARLVDNRAKDGLLAELAELIAAGRPGRQLDRALPTLSGVEPAGGVEVAWLGGVAVDGIADDRTSVERTRAFVKVQDGCSFHCTFCIIPRARGPERSLSPEAVLADVRRAVAAGHREVVLTGINVGTYDGGASERGPRGSHRRAALTLAGLIRRILAETDVERIRLSSIEPQHVDDELVDAWTSDRRRCLPHLHLPLQSGDDGILRRMGRRYTADAYAQVVERARAALPDLAVHADVIVGFPTEDDDTWARGLAFIRSLDLAGIHVFRYSARAGTPATRMTGQVDETTRRARAAELLTLAAECRAGFARRRVGRDASVLFETRLDDGRWVGHAPDNVLVAVPRDRSSAATDGPRGLENAIGLVRLTGIDPLVPHRAVGDLLGLDPPRRLRLPLVTAPTPAPRPHGGLHG